MLRSSTTPALRPLFHASVFFPRTQRLALSTIHGRFAKSPYPPLPLKSQPQHNHRSTTVTTFITPAPISAVQSINNISSMYFASNAVYEEKTEEKEEKASTPSKPDTPPRSMLPFYDRVEKIWHVHGSHIDSHVVSFECPVCFIKDDGEGSRKKASQRAKHEHGSEGDVSYRVMRVKGKCWGTNKGSVFDIHISSSTKRSREK